MKKGKRLLILLLAVLTVVAAFSLTSFAYSKDATYTEALLGSATLTAPDKVSYDGQPHGAVLEDNINGTRPSDYDYDDTHTQRAPYGEVSDITYAKSDADQSKLEDMTSAPIDAGYYLASVTVTVHRYITEGDEAGTWKDDEHVLTVFYQIKPAEVDAVWDDDTLVYDGTPKFPAATASVDDGEQVDLEVVSKDSSDPCIDAGNHKAIATLGEENSNYVLKKTTATKEYKIEQRPVTLGWYRPVYDATGEPTDSMRKVDGDTMIRLVYNGKAQLPEAKIENLVKNDTTDDTGKVEVVLEGTGNGDRTKANTYNNGKYSAKAVDLEGSRAFNYKITAATRSFQIIARPVELKWGYTPAEGEDAKYVDHPADGRNNDYVTTYNGVKQMPVTKVNNLAKNDDNVADVVKIGEPKLVKCESIAGKPIADDRVYIDAGNYELQPGELSNTTNYSYYLLEEDQETGKLYLRDGSDGNSEKYVADYDALYTISRYNIHSIAWENTSFTYDANYHLPTAKAKDLQGPDTNDDVKLNVEAYTAGSVNVDLPKGAWNANDDKGDPRYIAFVTDLTGDRADNYDVNNYDEEQAYKEYFIHKRALTVKAKDKTIRYGDAPANKGVTYSGLVNGNPNSQDKTASGTPGKYKDENKNDKAVVNGTVKYVYNYAKYGKPGSYTITPDVSGLTSRNYKISSAKGKLTVKNKVTVLLAKGTKKGNKAIKLSWNSVTGAASYDVYFSKCNKNDKKYKPKYLKTVKGKSLVVKKLPSKKKLKANTSYKYYVVAKDKTGKEIAKSLIGHCITGNVMNDDLTNAKSMSVNKTSVSLGKGGKAKLKASYKKAVSGSDYDLLNNTHASLTRFVCDNPEVAKVDANGTVSAVGKGWCRVYVQGVSGMWKTVEVFVK